PRPPPPPCPPSWPRGGRREPMPCTASSPPISPPSTTSSETTTLCPFGPLPNYAPSSRAAPGRSPAGKPSARLAGDHEKAVAEKTREATGWFGAPLVDRSLPVRILQRSSRGGNGFARGPSGLLVRLPRGLLRRDGPRAFLESDDDFRPRPPEPLLVD